MCHKQDDLPNCYQIIFVTYSSNKICIEFEHFFGCPTSSIMFDQVGQHALCNLGQSLKFFKWKTYIYIYIYLGTSLK